MRKVILFMHMSLDGFVCGPNGEQDWMTLNDDAMGKHMAGELLQTVDTILTGRVLYQGFAGYWPTVPKNPANPKELVEFAHWMEKTPKIVFSKTLDKAEWANAIVMKGSPSEEMARLKQQPGGDMVIFGGASLAAAFTEKGLVDEYRIKLEPVVLGQGRPLFKQAKSKMKLKLVKAQLFGSGVVGLYYQAG